MGKHSEISQATHETLQVLEIRDSSSARLHELVIQHYSTTLLTVRVTPAQTTGRLCLPLVALFSPIQGHKDSHFQLP